MVPRPAVCISVVVCYLIPTLSLAADIELAKPPEEHPYTQLADAELRAKYEGIWTAYDLRVKEAVHKVDAQFSALYENAKEAGNLDAAIFWGDMRKSWRDSGRIVWEPVAQKKDWKSRFGDAEFPAELAVVLSDCDDAFSEAKSLVREGYKKLEIELTKADKLEEALKIRKELSLLWATKSPAVAQSKPELPKAEKPAADPPGSSDSPALTAAMVRKLFAARQVSFDAKTGVLTLEYDFTNAKQLQDFNCNGSRPVVGNNAILLAVGDKISHNVKFQAGTVTGVFFLKAIGGRYVSTNGGYWIGITDPDSSADKSRLQVSGAGKLVEGMRFHSGELLNKPIPFVLTLTERQFVVKCKGEDLGMPIDDPAAAGFGQVTLAAGRGPVAFRNVTISGKVDPAWVQEILSK